MDNSIKKILIIGASGLLGSYLYNFFKDKGFEVLGTGFNFVDGELKKLDIRNREEVADIVRIFVPDAIFMPAAVPSVEFCEKNPIESEHTNVFGTQNVINSVSKKTLLVYFSSDYIFNGEKAPYKEEDNPCPINEYGKQKLLIENKIQEKIKNFIIIRTTGIYGWHFGKKNYVINTIDKLEAGEEIKAPSDQIYCPTYALDICKALHQLIYKKEKGIFNIVGSYSLSRYEFTEKIAEIFNLDSSKIVKSTINKLDLIAKRPHNTSLSINKLNKLGIEMSDVNVGLRDMLLSSTSFLGIEC